MSILRPLRDLDKRMRRAEFHLGIGREQPLQKMASESRLRVARVEERVARLERAHGLAERAAETDHRVSEVRDGVAGGSGVIRVRGIEDLYRLLSENPRLSDGLSGRFQLTFHVDVVHVDSSTHGPLDTAGVPTVEAGARGGYDSGPRADATTKEPKR